jgi:GTPase SAR1 family protein
LEIEITVTAFPEILIDIPVSLGAPTSMADNLTLVVVGDEGVGKSALAVRVCHAFFSIIYEKVLMSTIVLSRPIRRGLRTNAE